MLDLEKIIIQEARDYIREYLKDSLPVEVKEDSARSFTSEEVKRMLNIGNKAFNNLVDSGILKPTTIGHGFRFYQWQIEKFEHDYLGYDLSTYDKCLEAKKRC